MANLTGSINLVSSAIQYALFIVFTTIMFFFIDENVHRGILSSGEYVPGGVGGNPNVLIRVTGSPSHAAIAFLYLLIIIYALPLVPVCWVYAAEVWLLETRATGMGLAAVGNWLFNFALGLYVPHGFQYITWKMLIVFRVMCILTVIQLYFTYPETCGKTLEEVGGVLFPDGPKPRQTKPGNSKLDALVDDVRVNHKHINLGITESKPGLGNIVQAA
ncbi:hypothetical protein BDV38DRAFT_278684 [Aspergillus pseudotamarii]|uniref:General substrate transporter n=1 Tax=Aspergillus pseudotamarii TaxID=132259 RepID=A0A5N6T6I3_ASPPS|nr:uncharacterized protein BDV38DRAFT_278684 [Aspergillus pseudotamarii]KAE8141900.1 hypothetical protein BDV38DRAFT_278684 [Aspergillus pseudotamarii]